MLRKGKPRQTDGPAYLEMMTRLARRAGIRAGNDIGELPHLAEIQRATDRALTDAVVTLKMSGHTYEEIGLALGRSRKNAYRDFKDAVHAAEQADAAARAALSVTA